MCKYKIINIWVIFGGYTMIKLSLWLYSKIYVTWKITYAIQNGAYSVLFVLPHLDELNCKFWINCETRIWVYYSLMGNDNM